MAGSRPDMFGDDLPERTLMIEGVLAVQERFGWLIVRPFHDDCRKVGPAILQIDVFGPKAPEHHLGCWSAAGKTLSAEEHADFKPVFVQAEPYAASFRE